METYITGSSGFIGKNLCGRLGRIKKIAHKDIQSTDFSGAKRVFFLSSYGNLSNQNDVDKILNANVSDLVHVVKSVSWDIIESFVFTSTSSVKLRVQTMYSRTKKAAEEILLSYMERYDVPITIVRPMSVTGVGEQESHLIPTLIRSCLFGEKMDFVGNPTHDFIDVQDVVDGIVNLSDNRVRGIFELGTGKSYSNDDVLNIVERTTGKGANIKRVKSLRDYDNDNWVSNNFKSRSWGWEPSVSLEESIYYMVEGYKDAK